MPKDSYFSVNRGFALADGAERELFGLDLLDMPFASSEINGEIAHKQNGFWEVEPAPGGDVFFAMGRRNQYDGDLYIGVEAAGWKKVVTFELAPDGRKITLTPARGDPVEMNLEDGRPNVPGATAWMQVWFGGESLYGLPPIRAVGFVPSGYYRSDRLLWQSSARAVLFDRAYARVQPGVSGAIIFPLGPSRFILNDEEINQVGYALWRIDSSGNYQHAVGSYARVGTKPAPTESFSYSTMPLVADRDNWIYTAEQLAPGVFAAIVEVDYSLGQDALPHFAMISTDGGRTWGDFQDRNALLDGILGGAAFEPWDQLQSMAVIDSLSRTFFVPFLPETGLLITRAGTPYGNIDELNTRPYKFAFIDLKTRDIGSFQTLDIPVGGYREYTQSVYDVVLDGEYVSLVIGDEAAAGPTKNTSLTLCRTKDFMDWETFPIPYEAAHFGKLHGSEGDRPLFVTVYDEEKDLYAIDHSLDNGETWERRAEISTEGEFAAPLDPILRPDGYRMDNFAVLVCTKKGGKPVHGRADARWVNDHRYPTPKRDRFEG